MSSRTLLLWGGGIFGLAFLLRLLYLLDYSSSPIASYLILDPRFYYELAVQIASGDILTGQVLFKSPLYSYFLAAIIAIFGDTLFVPRLMQILMGSFSCVMVYLLAGRFYSNRVAVTAGIVAAAYGPLIMFDAEILIPSLIVFLDLISFYLLFKYEDSGKVPLLVGSALLLGLSSLARPNVLIFVPGVIFWLARYCKCSRKVWRRDILIYLVAIVLAMTPLLARNLAATGQFTLFGNYGGYNFLIGNNAQADGRTAVLPGTSPEFKEGYEDAIEIANRLAGRQLEEGELGWFWFKLGLDHIAADPFGWLWLEIRKTAYLIGGFEIPNNRHIYYFAENSPVLRFLLWDKIISFPFGVLLPLALITVFASRIRRDQFLLSFFVISYAVSILIFFVTGRFRVPLAPIIIIWGAAGFWVLVELYKKANYQRFYRLLLLLVALLILCNGLSYLSPFAVRPPNDYESHMFLGDAYHAAGKYEEAEKELEKAAELYPSSARVFNSLGNALAAQSKDSLAIMAYKRGIAADPNYETVKKSLASLYKRRNKLGELNNLLLEEMDRNPHASWAFKDYAYIHVLLEEKESALRIYEQAFAADSTDYEALFRKAQLYLDLNQLDSAEKEYLRLLDYLPNSIEVHANLGQTYARSNRLDEALSEFLWVQERDSENPSAYFNLASVYIQRREYYLADLMIERITELAPDFPVERIKAHLDNARQQSGSEP